jgi:uncharacterized protein
MPNRSSHSGHKPERTCVICRAKKYKDQLIRFVTGNDYYVIDYRHKLQQGRGLYLCDDNNCLENVEQWLKKQRKKKSKKKL